MHPDPGPTAALLLPPGALVEALRGAGVAAAVLRPATGPLRDVVVQRIAEVLENQLANVDLAGVVHSAWARAGELRDALARTRADPAAQEDVVLLDHEVTSEHHPSVEVLLDGRTAATLTFDVTLVLDLYGLVVVVQGGRVSRLRSGEVTAAATLAWRGRDVLAPPPIRILAGVLVPLGRAGTAGRTGGHWTPSRF